MKASIALGIVAAVLIAMGITAFKRIVSFAAEIDIDLWHDATLKMAAVFSLFIQFIGGFLLAFSIISFLANRKRKDLGRASKAHSL